MSSKRTGAKGAPAPPSSGTVSTPLANAVLVGGAISYGIGLLVMKGKVSWPPHQLLASIYTVAGSLALVGPLILARSGAGERGLGELLWMTAGLLIWVFDAAALLQGTSTMPAWSTPLPPERLGLTMLAVMLAGWRCGIGGRAWSWTNVTGWILGLYWIALALTTLWPGRIAGLGSR